MTRSSKTSLTPQQIKRYRERLQGENFRPFLSKPWQQERAIRKLAADGSEEAAASLADGVVSDCFCHRSLRIQALAELTQLSSQLQSATSIDALCRYWIESEEPEESLTNLLLVAGYAPSKPAERALFWLLSGQIQRYEDLDLDGTLLTQAHAKASPGLRKRLATAAAAEGRVEWLGAMEVAKTLNTFSEDNWSTTVQLLTQAGAVKALWEWALKAPPIHSRTLLRGIPAGTPPPAELGEAAAGLLRLARALPVVEELNQLAPEHFSRTLSGNTDEVRFISWSPDGHYLATSNRFTIRLWNLASGICINLPSYPGEFLFAWSPAGHCCASGDGSRIRLWDPAKGRCTHTLACRSLHSFAWSPDGRCLASGGDDSSIELWDPTSGTCTHTLYGHVGKVLSIAWSPDGLCLASCSSDNTIRLWDPTTGACTHTLSGHSDRVWSIAWSPDGRCLASCSSDKTIRLWDPSSGACTHTLSEHSDWVWSIAWPPDGCCLASTSQDGTIRLWDPASGACTHTLTFTQTKSNEKKGSIAWSLDGQCLASNCNFEIILWYPASGACTHTRSGTYQADLLGWSPDGRYLAYVGHDKMIKLWNGNFFSLLTIPLASYTDYQWSSLSFLQQESLGLEDWQRPWLEFIAALRLLVRRFDFSLDNQSSKTASSIFDIEIDG